MVPEEFINKKASQIDKAVSGQHLQTTESLMLEVNRAGCNAPRDVYNRLGPGLDAVKLRQHQQGHGGEPSLPEALIFNNLY
jgi:hypothetical protein